MDSVTTRGIRYRLLTEPAPRPSDHAELLGDVAAPPVSTAGLTYRFFLASQSVHVVSTCPPTTPYPTTSRARRRLATAWAPTLAQEWLDQHLPAVDLCVLVCRPGTLSARPAAWGRANGTGRGSIGPDVATPDTPAVEVALTNAEVAPPLQVTRLTFL